MWGFFVVLLWHERGCNFCYHGYLQEAAILQSIERKLNASHNVCTPEDASSVSSVYLVRNGMQVDLYQLQPGMFSRQCECATFVYDNRTSLRQ